VWGLKSKLPALLDPTEWYAMGQFFEGQIWRLASIEDRFHDVGSEKSALQNVEVGEKLERRQANSIVIDSELRLDKSIHNGIAGFEHLSKTDTQRYESLVVSKCRSIERSTHRRCSEPRLAEMSHLLRQGEYARRQKNAAR
jgi:hypothetical protein